MNTARATSFGAWANASDRWCPSYPDAAVDWLVPRRANHVAEVGAGTGKLTDRLVERGLDLDVEEPDSRMLALISERFPRLRSHESVATKLPLDDASVDAVLVADAWHWFHKEDAAREVSRVVRLGGWLGGWLGCVWNVPAPRHDWEWQALRLDPFLSAPADQDPLDSHWAVDGSRRDAGVPLDIDAHSAAVARLRVDGFAPRAAPRRPPHAGAQRG